MALTRPSDLQSPTAFTEVLNQVQSEAKHKYTPTNLPPRYPATAPQHILKLQKNAIPKGRFDYLPVYVFAPLTLATTMPRRSRS